jgi:hypothetical protein
MKQITSQKQIRSEFWRAYPDLSRRRLGADYPTDTRVLFIDFVDSLARNGDISEKLAQRATLE